MPKFFFFSFLLWAAFGCSVVHALCDPDSQVPNGVHGFGLLVLKDVAVGEPLTGYLNVSGVITWQILYHGYCSGSNYQLQAARPEVPGFSNVFSTGVPGVGYRIRVDDWPSGRVLGFANGSSAIGSLDSQVQKGVFYIQLVKTGPITPGRMASGRYATLSIQGRGPVSFTRIDGGEIRLEDPPTCSSVGPKEIDLGRLSAKAINDSTTSSTVWTSIEMSCDSGAKVSAKLSGTAPGGSSAIGLIKNNGSAAGVAVQMLNNQGNPQELGSGFSIANGGANTSYRVGARAYKVGTAGAGTINAQATLSVTYE